MARYSACDPISAALRHREAHYILSLLRQAFRAPCWYKLVELLDRSASSEIGPSPEITIALCGVPSLLTKFKTIVALAGTSRVAPPVTIAVEGERTGDELESHRVGGGIIGQPLVQGRVRMIYRWCRAVDPLA